MKLVFHYYHLKEKSQNMGTPCIKLNSMTHILILNVDKGSDPFTTTDGYWKGIYLIIINLWENSSTLHCKVCYQYSKSLYKWRTFSYIDRTLDWIIFFRPDFHECFHQHHFSNAQSFLSVISMLRTLRPFF